MQTREVPLSNPIANSCETSECRAHWHAKATRAPLCKHALCCTWVKRDTLAEGVNDERAGPLEIIITAPWRNGTQTDTACA
eukprot:9468361-Pyramimonas_sp.AAC.1